MNSILELLEAGWRLVSARGLGGMGSDLAMGLQAFSSRGLSLVLARVLREVRRLGRLDGAWSSPSLSLDISSRMKSLFPPAEPAFSLSVLMGVEVMKPALPSPLAVVEWSLTGLAVVVAAGARGLCSDDTTALKTLDVCEAEDDLSLDGRLRKMEGEKPAASAGQEEEEEEEERHFSLARGERKPVLNVVEWSRAVAAVAAVLLAAETELEEWLELPLDALILFLPCFRIHGVVLLATAAVAATQPSTDSTEMSLLEMSFIAAILSCTGVPAVLDSSLW